MLSECDEGNQLCETWYHMVVFNVHVNASHLTTCVPQMQNPIASCTHGFYSFYIIPCVEPPPPPFASLVYATCVTQWTCCVCTWAMLCLHWNFNIGESCNVFVASTIHLILGVHNKPQLQMVIYHGYLSTPSVRPNGVDEWLKGNLCPKQVFLKKKKKRLSCVLDVN